MKPYNVIVYQEPLGGRTEVRNGEGCIISSGLISNRTDNLQIQAAVNALPSIGGKILIMPGTYSFTNPVECDYLNGNICIEGSGAGYWDWDWTGIYPNGRLPSATTFIKAANTDFLRFLGDDVNWGRYIQAPTISNIKFMNEGGFTGRGIYLKNSVGFLIESCTFFLMKDEAIDIESGEEVKINRCGFNFCGSATNSKPTIHVRDTANTETAGIWVTGSAFKRNGYAAILGSRTYHDNAQLFFLNNYIEEASYIENGVNRSGCSFATIAGNFLEAHISDNYLCDCRAAASPATGIKINTSFGIVTGNKIEGYYNGVEIDSYNSIVSNNIFDSCASQAVNLKSGTAGSVISNNIFKNAGDASQKGILITDSDNVNITGNLMQNCKTTAIQLATSRYCLVSGNNILDNASKTVNGIIESGSANHNVIKDNFIHGSFITVPIIKIGANTYSGFNIGSNGGII